MKITRGWHWFGFGFGFGFGFIMMVGCIRVKSASDTKSARQSNKFAADVMKRKSCSTNLPMVDSGDKPTRVFHWTKNEIALYDAKAYVEGTVRGGLQVNKTPQGFKVAGVVGEGFYVGIDPFQSSGFGNILVSLDIKPHSLFPTVESDDDDGQNNTAASAYKANCPGVLYHYWPSLSSPLKKEVGERALNLWDLNAVDMDSIRLVSWNPKKIPDEPGLADVIADPIIR